MNMVSRIPPLALLGVLLLASLAGGALLVAGARALLETPAAMAGWGLLAPGALCLLLVGVALTGLRRCIRGLEQARRQAEQASRVLRETVEQLPAAIELYDPQDRLIVCNQRNERIYPNSHRARMLGRTYEELLRQSIAQGLIVEVPAGHEEEWVRQRLASRGSSGEPLLRQLRDGGWIHLHEARTPSGYLVVARLDVTVLIEKSLELQRVNNQLARLSTTDGLTGLANRRQFDRSLHLEWLRSARNRQPVSLLLIDIDFFKRYNDHYGHLAGDACLRQVAGALAECAQRSGELAARYGGEEFALLLPGADEAAAQVMAQRCVEALRQAQIPHAASPISSWLTLSIGIATVVANAEQPPEILVKSADSALYRVKATGRAGFQFASDCEKQEAHPLAQGSLWPTA